LRVPQGLSEEIRTSKQAELDLLCSEAEQKANAAAVEEKAKRIDARYKHVKFFGNSSSLSVCNSPAVFFYQSQKNES
jgi:hypothetical protein